MNKKNESKQSQNSKEKSNIDGSGTEEKSVFSEVPGVETELPPVFGEKPVMNEDRGPQRPDEPKEEMGDVFLCGEEKVCQKCPILRIALTTKTPNESSMDEDKDEDDSKSRQIQLPKSEERPEEPGQSTMKTVFHPLPGHPDYKG